MGGGGYFVSSMLLTQVKGVEHISTIVLVNI